jgi:hypothetical protein
MHTFTLPAAGRSRIIMLIMLSEMLCIILFDFKSDAKVHIIIVLCK